MVFVSGGKGIIMMGSFLSRLAIPVSGMTAQRLRMDVIGQNINNATTTMTEAGTPYRRQVTFFNESRTFQNINTNRRRNFGEVLNLTLEERRQMRDKGVMVTAVIKLEDEDSPFTPVYDPAHPHANEDGYYFLPNVNVAEEQYDLMAATQSYQHNLAVYDTMVQMTRRAISMNSR
jgi:flagellar basal-body rod protein FlgC